MARLKIGVLYGGRSVEHGVSVNSARNIEAFIDQSLYEVCPIGISTKGAWFLNQQVTKEIETGSRLKVRLDAESPCFEEEQGDCFLPDVIFPVLHGTDGEDGSIQGLIKAIDIPMVGTGVLGSSLSMNKLVAKQLMAQAGLPVAKYLSLRYDDEKQPNFEEIVATLGLPFMVKAANLGSSVGVSKVKSKADFKKAIADSFQYDHCILFEAYIQGREIECAILGNCPSLASMPGEIIIGKEYEFYTFDAKYVDPNAVKIAVPATLDKPTAEKIRSLSLSAFRHLQCEDFARVDLFLDADGNIFINEINTIPGFTNSSMYPMMWMERGISFTDLITKLIQMAMERYQKSKRVTKDFNSSLKF